MNITMEELGAVKRRLTVDLPPDLVAGTLETVMAKLVKEARIKGFRPGKAPRSVVGNVYKSQINHEVTERLISENLPRALDEKDLSPVAAPALESVDWEGGETGFKFSVSFEVKPVFDPVGWDQLSLTRIKPEVKEELIDERLEKIRKNMASVIKVEEDRPLNAAEDLAVVRYQVYENDQPLEKLAAPNAIIEMGFNNRFLPEFEAGLVGMRAGESRDIPATFPEDYYDESLRGKNVVFKATLQQIKRRDLPALDDEFVKDLGFDGIETLEALRAKLRSDFQKQAELRSAAELDNQVQQKLADLVDFEVPVSLINREVESMVNQFRSRLGRSGLTLEKIGLKAENLKHEYAEQAARNVKVALIVEKIAGDRKIEVSPEDIDAELARQAEQYDRPAAEIKSFYERRGLLDNLIHQLRMGQTLKLIKETAAITEITEPEAPAAEPADEE